MKVVNLCGPPLTPGTFHDSVILFQSMSDPQSLPEAPSKLGSAAGVISITMSKLTFVDEGGSEPRHQSVPPVTNKTEMAAEKHVELRRPSKKYDV